ncbi:MAG: FtsX-like permease family protein, partial [Ilumatobacter sp.]|nr:FtsX-like permease family protein [Ilumatobacter sp.]
LNAAGFGPGDTQLTINVTPFVVTLIAGTVVTLLCAVVPAIRSGRVPPLAAMRDVAIDRADVSMKRKITGGVSVLVAIGSVAAGLRGDARWLGVGVAALFTALIALGPFVAGPIARLASPALGKLRGASGTMAGRNAARNPKRTALTAGALAVGLSLIIGVATLGSSAKASIREVIGESFVGDYIVTPSDQQGGFVPPQLVQELTDADLGEVFPVGFSQVVLGDDTKGTFVAAIDPAPAEDLFNFDFTEGGFEQLTADGVLLQKDKASSLDVGMGDTVPVRLIDGTLVTLTVDGIYTTGGYTDILVNRALFTGPSANFLRDIQVYVKSNGGESAATTAALGAIVDQYPTVKVQSRDGFIDSTDDQIDGFLNFIYALLAMSVFIAAIGIVITLWLAVWERRRELGLLRAVGMTRRQVRSSVLWESIITGVVGVVMGTVLGTTLGWIIVKSFEDDGLGVFKLPGATISVAAIG